MINSYISDRTGERPFHVIGPLIGEITAWALVALCYFFKANFALLYITVLLAVGLFYSVIPVFWAWATSIFQNDTTSAASTAFILSIGSSGQIWAPSVTSLIFVSTGSYVWATLALCGFGMLGITPGIILAVDQKCCARNMEYKPLSAEEELSRSRLFSS